MGGASDARKQKQQTIGIRLTEFTIPQSLRSFKGELEVGARGFIARSLWKAISDIGVIGATRK